MNKHLQRLLVLSLTCTALAAGAQNNADDASDKAKRLEAARERLEQAAREVAELSGDVAGDHIYRFIQGTHFGQRKAMLGVVIEGKPGDGKRDGVEINGVSPDGPADKAGLKTGDVLLSLNGESLAGDSSADSRDKLLRKMEAIEPGAKVAVEYRRDGNTAKAEIEAQAMQPPMFNFAIGGRDFNFPGPEGGVVWGGPGPGSFFNFRLNREWRDLELVELTPALGKYFGAEAGVLVVRAPRDGKLKLEDGDIILSIDGRKPNNPDHALRILRSYAPGETLALEIMRDKRRQKLEVTMPEGQGDDAFMYMPGPMGVAPAVPAAPMPHQPPRPETRVIVNPKRGLGI
jgi:hypothetical protein